MKKIHLIFIFLFLIYRLNAQNNDFTNVINIGQSFTNDAVIHPFNGQILHGAAVTGTVSFNSDTSLVRIILVDTLTSNELLLYETYPMIDTLWSFAFTTKCDETCFLLGFPANAIKIIVNNATLYLGQLAWSGTTRANAPALQALAKTNIENAKIGQINSYISNEGMIWKAGQTLLSNLTYQNKVKHWGAKYHIYGYEYYAGGIFDVKRSGVLNVRNDYDKVECFDWRNRHGANSSTSPYWDGDVDSSGWMTPPKCQEGCFMPDDSSFLCDITVPCGSLGGIWVTTSLCGYFAAVAQVEALTNLYFNQHIDVDLSEQDAYSCLRGTLLENLRDSGVVNETCFKFTGNYEEPCSIKCSNPQEKIRIAGSMTIPRTEGEIKNALINYGPLNAAIFYVGPFVFNHQMVLVGYDIIDEGDVIYGLPDTVPYWSQYIGQPYWILKDSYGLSQAHNGYQYMFFSQMPGVTTRMNTPVLSLNHSENDRICVDRDNDGYYNWGIGAKPNTCPTCSNEKDGDDNNPGLGPIDNNGFCTIINNYHTSFEDHFDGWKQLGKPADSVDWVKHSGRTLSYPVSGPNAAQDGQYYIYINSGLGSVSGYPYKTGILESPLISFSNACSFDFSFWFHKKRSIGGGTGSILELQTSTDGGISWVQGAWSIGEAYSNPEWQKVILHLSSSVNKIRFKATTGQSWNNDIALDNIDINPIQNQVITIQTNVKWSDERTICGSIEINPGGILTLLPGCKLFFGENSKIIVKPGGILKIDSALLTSLPGRTWQGVQVWGNSSLPQNPSSYQGFLQIINSGTIENALVGATNYRPDIQGYNYPMAGYAGGMIHANKAKFINNKTAAWFKPYAPYSISSFTDCEFLTTTTLTPAPDYFIKMESVTNISFNHCLFANRSANAKYGSGMYSYNAQFFVDGSCTNPSISPCPSYINSNFDKLNYGIYATCNSSSVSFSVKHTDFTYNKRGLYVSGISGATITENNFTINSNISPGDTIYGLFLSNSTIYHVESNVFTGLNTSTTTKNIGIYVRNSGPSYNSIYRNTFGNLNYGTIAYGTNRNGSTTGLCLKCNNFTSTKTDIAVLPYSANVNHGIAYNQGYTIDGDTMPAGNLFSRLASNYWSITNSAQAINYVHHKVSSDWPRVKPLPVSGLVSVIQHRYRYYDTTYSCPSHLNPGGGQTDIKQLASTGATQTMQQLSSLVDGGNTAQMETVIDLSQSSEALELRNELLSSSPYLSDEVMTKAAQKENVLNNAMVRDVLVANSHSAKSEQVLQAVDNRTEPMPDYMKEQILQGQNTVSIKEELMMKLSDYKEKEREAYGNLYREYSENGQTFELMSLLQNDPEIYSKYLLASFQMDQNLYSLALQTINDISNDGLDPERLLEKADYLNLISIMHNLATDTTYKLEAGNPAVTALETLAAEDNLGGTGARNLMISEGLMQYNEPVILPEPEIKSIKVEHTATINPVVGYALRLFPNPAYDYVTVEYELPEHGTLEFSGIDGKMIFSQQLPTGKDQHIIPIQELIPGNYIVSLFAGNKILSSVKLTIQ